MSDAIMNEPVLSNPSAQVDIKEGADSLELSPLPESLPTSPIPTSPVPTSPKPSVSAGSPTDSPPPTPGTPGTLASPGTPLSSGKKRKKPAKRLWLPWEFCKLIEPQNGASLPPFGWEKPSAVTDYEKSVIASESETLFPVGFYDMTPAKRGVTKGRGDWKGKEALRLAHCSAEKNGCRFKARFCRTVNGMEIFTSGTHDIKAHLTPRKRGLAPAARAIVTKYRDESQSKLVEWLKDGGLLDDAGNDIEKVKQQIKRRKMTLKRKQKRNSQSGDGLGQEIEDNSHGASGSGNSSEEEEDPLFSAKIQMLQDDSIVSLIDPPEHRATNMHRSGGINSPRPDHYTDEDHFAEVVPFVGSNPFGDGPYSPTTVVDEQPNYSFQNVFEHPPLLHTTDLFPRNSHDYPLSHSAQSGQPAKREKPFTQPPPRPPTPPPAAEAPRERRGNRGGRGGGLEPSGIDPSGVYYQAAV